MRDPICSREGNRRTRRPHNPLYLSPIGMTRIMGAKLKVAGWISLGALAGAMATMQFTATARSSLSPLPLEELQQLAAVFGMIKSDYVEPVDEKKLINDAISGMVSGLDPHSQFFDKKSFTEF